MTDQDIQKAIQSVYDTVEKIAPILVRKAAEKAGKQIRVGEVRKINNNDTCEVALNAGTSNELLLPDVRLHSIIDDLSSWVRVTPKIGSKVLCGCIEDYKANYMCIMKTSEIEKVDFKIGNKTLEMTKDGFVFNGGNNHGLIKIEALWDKLQKLENAYNGHTHISAIDPITEQAPLMTADGLTVAGTLGLPIISNSNNFVGNFSVIEDKYVSH